jgi:flagella basal body P-ring formation protein FlgA
MRRFTCSVVLALLLGAGGAGAQVPVMTLSLKADALVDSARVRLADLVRFDGSQAPESGTLATARQTLAAIDISAAPLPGYTQRVSRKEIERLVRSRGVNVSLHWDGADAVRVERRAVALDAATLAGSATSYLRDLLARNGDRVELQSSALPELQAPTGTITLRPRALTLAQALHRQVTVWVDVVVDDVFVRSAPVSVTVHAYRTVLAARRDLAAGSVPECEALQPREEDVTTLDGAPAAPDCHLVRGHLTRPLAAGTTLLASHLRTPMAVAQGDSVSLQLLAGGVLLEARAVAVGDGEVGQRVYVRPSSSSETILAEVIAPGIVKVSGK